MTVSRLSVHAVADIATLPRMMNYIAQLGMTPRHVRSDKNNEMMTIIIELDGLTEKQLALIAEKMRSSTLVETVQLTFDRNEN